MLDELTQGDHRPYRLGWRWAPLPPPPGAGQPTPRPPLGRAWCEARADLLGFTGEDRALFIAGCAAELNLLAEHDSGDCDCADCRAGRKR